MRVKQSTFTKAKDNTRCITHPMFLVIVLLTSGKLPSNIYQRHTLINKCIKVIKT